MSLNKYKPKPFTYISKRNYSSLPNKPVFTLHDLTDQNLITINRSLLSKKAGIYSIINTINGKQYIGSAVDLYLRLNEHLSGRKSNKALQIAINKYGLGSFKYHIYEFFTLTDIFRNSPGIKLITDLETFYLKKFDLNMLYNFKHNASNMLGYKHSEEAKQKMSDRFKDKINHPFSFFYLIK